MKKKEEVQSTETNPLYAAIKGRKKQHINVINLKDIPLQKTGKSPAKVIVAFLKHTIEPSPDITEEKQEEGKIEMKHTIKGKRYVCPTCGKDFASNQYLKLHMQKKHPK